MSTAVIQQRNIALFKDSVDNIHKKHSTDYDIGKQSVNQDYQHQNKNLENVNIN